MLTTMFKIEVERNLVMKCEISVRILYYYQFTWGKQQCRP